MSKRQLEQLEQDQGPASKRPKTESFDKLLQNANSIVECLQSLKTNPKVEAQQSLAILSKKLFPLLAHINADTVASNNTSLDEREKEDATQSTSTIHAFSGVLFNPPNFVLPGPWTKQDSTHDYPPLPPVKDPVLQKSALTHSGVLKNKKGKSYEYLEWIGDAFLFYVATQLIFDSLPQIGPGRASQIRELLVRNSTLETIAKHYGLDKRIDLPNDVQRTRKEVCKVHADVMEAYVGALIESDKQSGRTTAAQWLKDTWIHILKSNAPREFRMLLDSPVSIPQITEQTANSDHQIQPNDVFLSPSVENQFKQSNISGIREIKTIDKRGLEDMIVQSCQGLTAKEGFANLIAVPAVKIRYQDMPCKAKDSVSKLPLFSVGVFVDGWGEKNVEFGHGTALSKKEAGQRAAEAALHNKKLMRKWIEKKQSYLAARETKVGASTGHT